MLTVRVEDCEPNPWNPNRMDAFTYGKTIESIKSFGFIDPLTVRPHPKKAGGWQIIDGENRWKVARDLGIVEVPAFDVGTIDDHSAMKLTIILNELRGQYDPIEMGNLLESLLKAEDMVSLSQSLPFTDVALKGMIGLKDFDFGTPGLRDAALRGEQRAAERKKWVERMFRLSPEANEIVSDALARAREEVGGDMPDSVALEMICADYLAGPGS